MSQRLPARMNLADEVRGAWDHCIVMTYTANLEFFERAILPLLSSTRGRLVLADAPHLLESQSLAARGRLVRSLNRSYLVAGISMPKAAHAKLILLLAADKGRLLVGSGNLGLTGWASIGELFTKYDFAATDHSQLDAFLSIRGLLDGLVQGGFLDAFAGEYLERIWQGTPWMTARPDEAAASPVRHSLRRPLADQFIEAVASTGPEVDELIMLAPFHDATCSALDHLVKSLKPKKARLLLQPLQTSAKRSALKAVLRRHPGLVLQPFDPKEGYDYVHAKLLIAVVGDMAVCLQGSANLSRPALLRSIPVGNLEACNLLVGTARTFKALLHELELGKATRDPDDISVSFAAPADPDPGGSGSMLLLEARWEGTTMVVRFTGPFGEQPRKQLLILVGREPLLCRVLSWESSDGLGTVCSVRLDLPAGADTFFSRAVPVAVLAADPDSDAAGSEEALSNPLYCVNQPVLFHQLGGSSAAKRFADVGVLDIADDHDLEELLRALQGSMVFDKRTLLEATGSTDGHLSDDISDADMLVAYEDVDYEALRQSHRLRQYGVALRHGMEAGPILSDFQLALRSITDAFNEVIGHAQTVATARGPVPDWMQEGEEAALEESLALEEEDSSSIEEQDIEEETEADQHRRWTSEARMRLHWKNFIKRFLSGMSSPAWRELAGDAVIAGNYLIFSHIMDRLHRQRWVDLPFLDFLLQSKAKTHAFVWGDGSAPAWIDQLGHEELDLVLDSFAEQHIASRLIMDLAAAGSLTTDERFGDVLQQARKGSRDVGRAALSHPAWPSLARSANVLSACAAIARDLTITSDQACWLDPPSEEQLVENLRSLLESWSVAEVVHFLTKELRLPGHSAVISNIALGEGPFGLIAKEFKANPTSIAGREFRLDELLPALALWMRLMPGRNLRLSLGRSRLLYRSGSGTVVWSPTLADEGAKVQAPALPKMAWDAAIADLAKSVAVFGAIA